MSGPIYKMLVWNQPVSFRQAVTADGFCQHIYCYKSWEIPDLCVGLCDALGSDGVKHALRLEVFHYDVHQTGVLDVQRGVGRVLGSLSGVRHPL